ncbi:hypothetical protein SBRY_140009 [Actinacidiphila bryophytorum]|uniref:Uncharacterized protein n=1 Tax=Actinacidiphila bryophytorum TaxID=1436133 RepID=A0A9W4E2I1_9ACTN|nr:hypothetical protein SBRY_140009 [Actinacidiphila bryophytorum]
MIATCCGVACFPTIVTGRAVPRAPQKRPPSQADGTPQKDARPPAQGARLSAPALREGGNHQGRGELRDQPRRRGRRSPTARGSPPGERGTARPITTRRKKATPQHVAITQGLGELRDKPPLGKGDGLPQGAGASRGGRGEGELVG